MQTWIAFLNSLSTRGGAIAILLFLTTGADIAAFVLYLRHDLDFRGLSYFVTSGGLVNALMLGLKGSSDATATTTVQDGKTTASATTDSGKVATTEQAH